MGETREFDRQIAAERSRMEAYEPDENENMHIAELFAIVQICENEGIQYSMAGGYGLDMLYGKPTRDHGDIDMLIKGSYDGLHEQLTTRGYVHDEALSDSYKRVYTHPDISDWKVEVINDEAVKMLGDVPIDELYPVEPNAQYMDKAVFAPTLQGQRAIMRVQNARAKSEQWGRYDPNKEINRTAILACIAERQ